MQRNSVLISVRLSDLERRLEGLEVEKLELQSKLDKQKEPVLLFDNFFYHGFNLRNMNIY